MKTGYNLKLDEDDRAALERMSASLRLSAAAALRVLIRAGAGEPHARKFVLDVWAGQEKEQSG